VLDQTRRDAMASVFMRRLAEELEAIAQLEKSRDLEIQWIVARYATELTARRDRARRLESAAVAVAQYTKDAGGYVGKKKSRAVGAGTYGYRTNSECVELTDEAAYIAFAEQYAPETLRVKPTLTLAQAKEYLTETELAGVKREIVKKEATALAEQHKDELPAGFVKVPETDEFYAKPLPAAATAGTKVG
jgi:phage host-nuclease inhibitor protein Gam